LPYREGEEEGGESETDEDDDGKRSEGLGFERLIANPFYFDNANGVRCKIASVAGDCQYLLLGLSKLLCGTCDVWHVVEFGRLVGKGPVEACQVLEIVHLPDDVPNVIYVISVVS
jgi:hypothetical protein